MSLNAEGFYRANGYKPEAHVRRDLARGATIDCLRMAKLALSATRAPNETAVPLFGRQGSGPALRGRCFRACGIRVIGGSPQRGAFGAHRRGGRGGPRRCDMGGFVRAEAARLLPALPPELVPAIEHIGSTSVPDLDAKPIIDIMLGIARPDRIEELVPILEGFGYESLGTAGLPGRWALRRRTADGAFNISVVAYGGGRWRENLATRSYL